MHVYVCVRAERAPPAGAHRASEMVSLELTTIPSTSSSTTVMIFCLVTEVETGAAEAEAEAEVEEDMEEDMEEEKADEEEALQERETGVRFCGFVRFFLDIHSQLISTAAKSLYGH